ncbi:MAG: RNA-binding transcriptional accessory protein [Myxococcales bacterium]|nr:MAG: RNA-binding transcriptional accessory protein [Myxococcales bacterium]
MDERIIQRIADETRIGAQAVAGALALFAEGNTIPFVARYRKERTGGLDEVQLAKIRERGEYYTDLEARKQTVLGQIESQGKLTEELKRTILACMDAYELEDLYLPYKPKRRTRAQVARELGLDPLADKIIAQTDEDGDPVQIAGVFGRLVNLSEAEEALKGAKDILAERICENPEIRRLVRDLTWREGLIECRLLVDKAESSGKYEAFHKTREPVRDIPSHRILAILRGSREKELGFRISVDQHEVFLSLDAEIVKNPKSIWKRDILEAIRDAYERLLAPQIETELRGELKRRADAVAIDVFAENLRVLLLQPPLMGRTVLALDPGFRTGVKLAVVDATGKLLEHDVVYPLEPKNDVEGTFAVFDRLAGAHALQAVAVGNGTGGREAFRVVRRWLRERGRLDAVVTVLVNEAGASIYSASEVAREEFPDLDLTVRGAISIGRRLQDPLAELVKIEPKSIGVGQYQHDVEQKQLERKLDEVVELCVNSVGVDVNTASMPLLSRVAGLNARTAQNIVTYRNEKGPYKGRRDLLAVKHFGEKSFEQAAGFLRVVGEEPLDNSAVHPERYELVRRMAADLGVSLAELIGNADLLGKIDKRAYLSDEIGEYTLNDILAELAKPNRDPRADFSAPDWRDELNDIKDLDVGMELEGVVTNVAKFGVFVDVGVHQDGMIHISELDHRFINDPAEAAKVGDRVKVKVIEVDAERKRIGLSRKQLLPMPKPEPRPPREERRPEQRREDRGPRPDRGRPDDRGPRPDRRDHDGRLDRRGPREAPQPKKDVIASGRMAELLMAVLKKNEDNPTEKGK